MNWPFDQAPEVAALTTSPVVERGFPVLRVQHFDDDHSWAFLCNTTNDPADARMVSMQQIVDRDATVRDVADLPPGWVAYRAAVGGEWTRERQVDDS